MKIPSPSGDAPLGETPIIPEVHHEDRFVGPEISKPFPYTVPLFRSGHEADVRITTNGDIMKIPEENASLLHEKIDERIACNGIRIPVGLGGRDGEEDACFFEPAHHTNDPVEIALSSSGIGLLPEAFEADRRNDIAQGDESLDHLFIDQGAIGINLKSGILMLLEEIEEVPSQKRLSAGDDHQVDAHFLAFPNQAIHHLKRELFFGRIGTRITAIAVQIAPHRGAHQHRIGWCKTPLRFKCLSAVGTYEKLIDDKIFNDFLPVMRMGFAEDPSCDGQGRMIGLEECPDPPDL